MEKIHLDFTPPKGTKFDDNGVPYTEEVLRDFRDDVDVTIRRYPANTFISYIDYDEDRLEFSGFDIEDLFWIETVHIWKKIPNKEFVRKAVLEELRRFLDDR